MILAKILAETEPKQFRFVHYQEQREGRHMDLPLFNLFEVGLCRRGYPVRGRGGLCAHRDHQRGRDRGAGQEVNCVYNTRSYRL